MDDRSWGSFHLPSRDLASLASFDLGRLRVDPSLRQLAHGERRIVVQPRVMRLLVALVAADGRVLSRDELIETCWDGHIVGDNAINRVVSHLRRALAGLVGDAVRVETITKVGLRLVVEPAAERLADVEVGGPGLPGEDARRASVSRRGGLIGGLMLFAGGSAAWLATRGHRPHPEARDLFERGQQVQKTGNMGAVRQAMSFYKQAIAIDPRYADAWGALAIGYRHGLDGFTTEEKMAYPRLMRAAAQRALALDPDQVDAKAALALPRPNFRRWLEHERNLRALLSRYPDYWYGHAQLGLIMQDVGRFDEAVAFAERTLEIDPMLPIAWGTLARALFHAGRDQDADIALDRAFARWPAHPFLWYMRYGILVAGYRYAEASAFARDPRTYPDEFPGHLSETYGGLSESLLKKDAAGIRRATDYLRGTLSGINIIVRIAPLLERLGARDLALDGLHAFYFGGTVDGNAIAAPGPLDVRLTLVLFSPPILALRDDPRHGAMLLGTGLEDYWRRSGSQPDYRRT